jgi:phenylalanine-4-hydroxylase
MSHSHAGQENDSQQSELERAESSSKETSSAGYELSKHAGSNAAFSDTYYSLPDHLKQYCTYQDYDAYTARDHATWRYIMRQNREFFKDHAVPVYVEGLKKTGIPIHRIPDIQEMDAALKKLGWGAVAVCGFIPPAAFLEFQARGVLAIATGMRTIEHVDYTPAPDIVHEAAGHAPIIVDKDYAAYLRRYAKMAQKAILSKEDLNLYEAIRHLSDIKENPEATEEELEKAEEGFKKASKSITYDSEASKVSRMAWWTVEYGITGTPENPKIYGAGLLSSIGESQNIFSDKVKKVPLTVECVNQSYDITEHQPQLFQAPNMQRLTDILEEFEKTLSFVRGGGFGLETAKEAETVNTVELDSGLQISGIVHGYSGRNTGTPQEELEFVEFEGPCQFAHMGEEIPGQGTERHQQGFSSPLGLWAARPDRSPSELNSDDLFELGIVEDEEAEILYTSGFKVSGFVKKIVHKNNKLLYITFEDCTVLKDDVLFFESDWGPFDLAVAEKVSSVFGGPADLKNFGEFNMGSASSAPGINRPYTQEELDLFKHYQKIRDFRSQGFLEIAQIKELEELAQKILREFPKEWLLQLEIVELVDQLAGAEGQSKAFYRQCVDHLHKLQKEGDETTHWLIEQGLKLSDVSDDTRDA